MTIREIIYNIRHLIKDNKSDDLKFTDRNLEFMVNYIREKLIVQHLQKNRSVSSNIVQDLGQIPLVKVDTAEGAIATGNYILKSTVRIPQPIELDQKDLITYVGSIDRQAPAIPFKTKAEAYWMKQGKYSCKQAVSYLHDGYLYITNHPNANLKWIHAEGVFLNPRDVHRFKRPNGNPCYNPDTDQYPISGRMLDMLNSIIKKQELDLYFQIAEDTSNDASAQ